jgi:hypothetical protein
MPFATPRFIADAMLGRLAKWLRLLGVDTVYDRAITDAALIRRAAAEGRVLLTRDRRLLRRRALPAHLLIRSDDFRAQLREVLAAFPMDPHAEWLSRCARCNSPLQPLPAAAARAVVPAYVRATQTRFLHCARCQRIYWPATHVERIRAELARILSAAG